MSEYSYVSSGKYNKRKVNGRLQSISKHRYVWMEHYGEIPKGMIIHHIDGNKFNNSIENLKCITSSEHNKLHRKKQEDEPTTEEDID